MGLNADSQAVLDYLNSKPNNFQGGMDWDARQAAYLSLERELAGEGPEVEATEDFTLSALGREQRVRAYWPSTENQLPILIWFHGGGFVAGDLEGNDTACRLLCKGSGCLVVNANYALAPRAPYPAALEDGLEVAKWILDEAGQLGADPIRLALGGSSAGGNVALNALLALGASGQVVRHLLLVYPWLDLSMSAPTYRRYGESYYTTFEKLDWARNQYVSGPAFWIDPVVSPLLADNFPSVPGYHLIAAEYDPIRGDVESLRKRLESSNLQVKYSLYPGTMHGFFHQAKAVKASRVALAEAAAEVHQGLARD